MAHGVAGSHHCGPSLPGHWTSVATLTAEPSTSLPPIGVGEKSAWQVAGMLVAQPLHVRAGCPGRGGPTVMTTAPVPAGVGILVRACDRPGFRLPAVWLRPLSCGETDVIEQVFTRMSAESRRLRFLAPVPRLTARALHRLADVDHHRH